jgi:hypothetical protein
MKRLAVVLVVAVLAACGGGGDDAETTTTASDVAAPTEAPTVLDECTAILDGGDQLSEADFDTCLGVGAVTQDCGGGVTTAVVILDGQPWGLQVGEVPEELGDDYDVATLCPGGAPLP